MIGNILGKDKSFSSEKSSIFHNSNQCTNVNIRGFSVFYGIENGTSVGLG